MPALYLNGKLCNGSGKSKEEYTLAELKKIAKDNGVFVYSGSNKEDICKELISYNKTKDLPIVIAPQIAQTKVPIVVQPTIITRAKAAYVADLNVLKDTEERIVANAVKAAKAAKADQAAKAASNAAKADQAAANAAKAAQVKAASNATANAAKATQAKAASNAAKAAQAKADQVAKAAANVAKAASNAAAKAAQAKVAATKTRATPKPRETSNDCVKQDVKKYVERPSPPYPANECRGKIMKGNNGEMYISKPTSTGVYRWVKNK